MKSQTQAALFQYVDRIHEIYGSELKAVILYGSYARGDYTESSDIDILIMPIVKNVNHFQYWLPADPFYKNVKNEGVELYVA